MTTEGTRRRKGTGIGTEQGWPGQIFEPVTPVPPVPQVGADNTISDDSQLSDQGQVIHAEEAEVEISGVYIISVAARLLEMHPQTLRKYERFGIIRPSRTAGSLRLYSDQDLQRLRIVRRLVEELGLNLAGVRLLMDVVTNLRHAIDALEAESAGGQSAAADRAIAHMRAILDFVDA
ncbi:MAG: MerR family transcriptional regulator [Chloroflexi bacterium]|nr:MerR family transcriptional regulator [Chloroflexota bacterium]